MPAIRSSTDLRNNYNEISTQCHSFREPIFITKNGQGDLAVMSIESYEEMVERIDLYRSLLEGLEDVDAGRTQSLSEAMADIRAGRKK